MSMSATARLRGLSPLLVVGLVLVVASAINYLTGYYTGAVVAGLGGILACAFAVLTGA